MLMPWIRRLRRALFWASGTAFTFSLICLAAAWPTEAQRYAMVGTQAWGPFRESLASKAGPRVSVLETDTWRHSLIDGRLISVPQLPLPGRTQRADLLHGAHFTAVAYLEQIEALRSTYSRQRDILMYYGGIRLRPAPEGLNFNGWSGHDLQKLRALGCRPFIGLETMDRKALRALVWRLKEAGYGPLDRIYVRIGSEPAYSSYERTPEAYRHAFARTAGYINAMNRRLRLNIHTVFAGANHADFTRYSPSEYLFDAIGYDLYVTPENKEDTLKQLQALSRRYPYKPLVLPEFGIATTGPAHRMLRPNTGWANPDWAVDALGDVLSILGKHPGGIEEITVFSVNVSGRLEDRRWSWAWTPRMYEMLKEWQGHPRTWKKEGFHRYDPQSYPVGRDILYLDRPDAKIIYRKLPKFKAADIPLFQEIRFSLRGGVWEHASRNVFFLNSETREY
jgi:hypothetical protein